MRQAPQSIGQVQRQVTARPVQQLQAYQQQVTFDPNSDRLAKGLMQFVDVTAGIAKQVRDEELDAQAATADIGLDGYQRAMKGAIDADPELFDRPDELSKLDQEMRQKYLGSVTDERILSRANQRIDNWLSAETVSYGYAKADKQRLELGSKTLQLTVSKIEEQVAKGADRQQAITAIKGMVKHLQDSPSFRFSKERTEDVIKELQELGLADGSRSVLLAEAFMDDEDVSVDTRVWLKAKHAKAMELTTVEKEQLQVEVLRDWDSRIQSGRLTWEYGSKAVASGLATAEQLNSAMSKQRTRMEKLAKEAEERAALINGDFAYLTSAQTNKLIKGFRQEAEQTGQMGRFYDFLRSRGLSDPVTTRKAEMAFAGVTAPVDNVSQIPPAFRSFMNGEGAYLFGRGELGQHLPPEKLVDAYDYLYMTQHLGMNEAEAYNLLVASPHAKYTDIPKSMMLRMKDSIREDLGVSGDQNTDAVDMAMSVAMRIAKHGQLDPEDAFDYARKLVKDAYVQTDYGPLPKARFLSYTNEEGLNKRLEWAAKQTAKELDIDSDDLQVMHLPDGRFTFTTKGGYVPVYSKSFSLMTSNQLEADGQMTVEGERQESIIDEQQRLAAKRLKRDRRAARHGIREPR